MKILFEDFVFNGMVDSRFLSNICAKRVKRATLTGGVGTEYIFKGGYHLFYQCYAFTRVLRFGHVRFYMW